jgi:hypothetical protein
MDRGQISWDISILLPYSRYQSINKFLQPVSNAFSVDMPDHIMIFGVIEVVIAGSSFTGQK